MSDIENSRKTARQTADADVESIEVGDTASDVEAKVLGLTHISGVPSHDADDAEEAEEEVDDAN